MGRDKKGMKFGIEQTCVLIPVKYILLAMWLWTYYFTSQHLSLFIFKIGVMMPDSVRTQLT